MIFDKNFLKSLGVELKLEEFVERWSHRLPVLMVTTVGYCGCDEWMHEVSTGEYYWVYDVHRQTRLVAETVSSKYLSIPVDYPIKFNLLDKLQNAGSQCLSGRDLLSLLHKRQSRAIIGELWVQFEGDKPVNYMKGADNGFSEPLGPLKIIDQYEQKYLLAYTVHEGFILSRPIPIPVYLDITVDVFVGFKHSDSYAAWSKEVEVLTQKCSKSSVPMCNEVIMFPEKPSSGEYDYLHYLVAGQDRTTKPTNMGASSGLSTDPPSPRSLAPKRLPGKVNPNKKHGHESYVERTPGCVIKRYQLPEIPDKQLKYEPLTSGKSKTYPYTQIGSAERKTQNTSESGYGFLTPGTDQNENLKKPNSAVNNYKQDQSQFSQKQAKSTPTQRVPPTPRQPLQKVSSIDKELLESIQRRAEILKKQEQKIEGSGKSWQRDSNTTSDAGRSVQRVPSYSGKVSSNLTSDSDDAQRGRFQAPSNQEIKASRTNNMDQNRSGAATVSGSSNNNASLKKYGSATDVPKDIDFKKLGISDVIHCFKLLNLGEYSDIITQKQIDGELLMGSIQDLKSLGIPQFDVNKVQKFIDGWRLTP